MKIQLIAVGTKMPAWVNKAFVLYQKRLPKQCRLELIEVPAIHRGKNADIQRILHDEAKAIKKAASNNALIIALDRKGKAIDTEKLSQNMRQWIDNSQDVAIIIGGPEGLDKSFMQQANQTWTLSALTFAHPLVRVMLAEQIYRGWSIIAGLPYHRGE